jgi:hypothetical protein
MQLIDPNHPTYRPLWVRIAIVAVCLGWASIELITGEPFWAILVGAVGVYAAWVLLLNFNPQPPASETATVADAADDEKGIEKDAGD